MKKLLAILGLLLLAGCARYEVVPTDALVSKWTWERVVEAKNRCAECEKQRGK